ncbi:MAG: hypothetical protein Q8P41_31385 [Pseudomonadota bacterium]|nr:hypothetical protein [Pseudomonadota bacterium]
MRPLRALVLLFVGVAACAKHEPLVTSGRVDGTMARAIQAEGVSIAPVVRVQELPAPPIAPSAAMGQIEAELREGEEHLPAPSLLDVTNPRDAAFLRNEYFGNIRFGGGFVRTGDVALEVRARLIEFGLDDRYAADGSAWLRDALPRVLDAEKVPVGAPVAAVAPVPERRRFRGLHPEDGHDNVNLPRTELIPAPLDDAARAAASGSRWVIVPYLRSYYTHNGGWFLGQTFGCTAGARLEALVVLYDTTSGRPVWSMPLLGRHIQAQKGQASTAELDQYLLWAEAQAEEQLRRGWLK